MFPPPRKGIRRSRNGCAVCKSKRLKCDEAKPGCSRCERLGIPCPGYVQPLKWTKTPSTTENTTWVSGNAHTDSSSDMPYPVSSTPRREASLASSDRAFDLEVPDLFGDAVRSLGMSCLATPDKSSFGSPFPFEELVVDMDAQPEQLSTRAQPFPPNQEHADEEAWSNAILNVAKPAYAHVASATGFFGEACGSHTKIPQLLPDYSSILVEYYFKEVCGMMSCYDSQLNPYRTTISNSWSSSQALYYTTQSMAAACLSEVSPNLAILGPQLERQAEQCLLREAEEPEMQTQSLLAAVMLGMSRSWHDPRDVGRSEFGLLARKVLPSTSLADFTEISEKQKMFFFTNSLVYWQMLLAFVSDQEPIAELRKNSQPRPAPAQTSELQLRKPCMPHPQTGTGSQVQLLVAEVGSLVRKERKRIQGRRFSSKRDIEEAAKAIRKAEQLHSDLCAVHLPQESVIVDSGDDLTPANHLVRIAEAYRCTGLLQLYRNFPDLLSPFISTLEGEFQDGNLSGVSDSGKMADSWLVCLALHILDLIQDVPLSSRSRSIQPLLLVSICSDLKLGNLSCVFTENGKAPVESILFSRRFKIRPTDLDVLRARRFLISRLSAFENILAAKPIRTMLLLVKDTWARMENPQSAVYWMDVMMEKGHETLMG